MWSSKGLGGRGRGRKVPRSVSLTFQNETQSPQKKPSEIMNHSFLFLGIKFLSWSHVAPAGLQLTGSVRWITRWVCELAVSVHPFYTTRRAGVRILKWQQSYLIICFIHRSLEAPIPGIMEFKGDSLLFCIPWRTEVRWLRARSSTQLSLRGQGTENSFQKCTLTVKIKSLPFIYKTFCTHMHMLL